MGKGGDNGVEEYGQRQCTMSTGAAALCISSARTTDQRRRRGVVGRRVGGWVGGRQAYGVICWQHGLTVR